MLKSGKINLRKLLNHVVLNKTSRELSSKPFYYQELFEHAKPLNTPYKKLTSTVIFGTIKKFSILINSSN